MDHGTYRAVSDGYTMYLITGEGESMKRLAVLILSGIMAAGALTGCTMNSSLEKTETTQVKDDSEKKIAFISPTNNFDYFVYIGAMARKTAEENKVQIDCWDAAYDFTKVADFVDLAVVQGYDAIVVANGDNSAEPAIREAAAKGVPLINYDSALAGDFYAQVMSSNKQMGKMLGDYAVQLITEADKAETVRVIISGMPTSPSDVDREAGIREALSVLGDKVEIETVFPSGTNNSENVQSLWDDLLISKTAGTVDYIFCTNSGTSLGVLSSVLSAGRNEIEIFGIDDEDGQISALQDPSNPYLATVGQDPFSIGKKSVECAIKAMNGERSGVITVDAFLYTKENVSEALKEKQALKEELNAYK